MRYQKLGNTGLFVSELCLGTMTFGGEGGMWGKIGQLQQSEAEQLVGRALDAGINFIDTANVYSEGRSEEITGALKNLKIPRENVVVAAKCLAKRARRGELTRQLTLSHYQQREREPAPYAARPYRSLPASRFRPATPMEEMLYADNGAAWARALHRCLKLGRVADRQSAGHFRATGSGRFASLQAYYTIAGRDLGANWCQWCKRRRRADGLEPAGGWPAERKYGRDGQSEAGGRRLEFDFPPVEKARLRLCGCDAHYCRQRRLRRANRPAWLLHQKAVTSVIVVPNGSINWMITSPQRGSFKRRRAETA